MATTSTYDKEVQKLYVAYFSRPADVAGLEYWSNLLSTSSQGYQLISSNFAASQEYRDAYAGMDNSAIVSTVYTHLFGRAAESAGVDYWVNLLNTKQITIDNVVTQIAAGAQSTDLYAYNAKVAVATAFTTHLDLPAEQQGYSTALGLKTGIDYIAGVKDILTAATAIDPGNIDINIAKFTPGGATGVAETVGVAQHEALPVYG
jgi:hypothetical protein